MWKFNNDFVTTVGLRLLLIWTADQMKKGLQNIFAKNNLMVQVLSMNDALHNRN